MPEQHSYIQWFGLYSNGGAKRKTSELWERLGCMCYGGDEEDRTLDLTDANRTLSQLSYAPMTANYLTVN